MIHRYVSQLVAAMLLVTFGASAHAAGVNLRWNACAGDGGVSNRTSACNSNTGSQSLTASYVVGAAVTGINSMDSRVVIAAASATVPGWWQFFQAGTCRPTAITENALIPATAVACSDPFSGTAASGIATYTPGALGPSTTQFIAYAATTSANAALAVGQEYFAFNLVVRTVSTTGAGSCSGCLVPVCILLQDISLYTGTGGVPPATVVLTAPANGIDSNFATWQGGLGAGPLPGGGCPAATPTRNSTWGSVKSLYR